MDEQPQGTVAVFGATGFTGRLVLRELRRRGIRSRAVARSEHKLEALRRDWDAGEPEQSLETRTADAGAPSSVRAALEGADIVIACAGPFQRFGRPALDAAVELGAHYLDSTGEQHFVLETHRRHDEAARARGLRVVNALAFEIALADMAASVAARGMGELEDVVVAYAMSSSVASRGTRLSILEAVQSPGLHWEGGSWIPSRVGSTRGQIRFPQPPGPRSCVAIPGADNVTIPRHVATRRCQTFMAMPRGTVVGLGLGGWALPTLLRSPLGRRARKRASAGPIGPTDSQRAANRFTILVEALGSQRFRRATVRGVDPYGITGVLLAEGARRLLSSEGLVPDAAGVLAPAQAFRPEPFFAALASADLSLDLEEGDLAAPEPS